MAKKRLKRGMVIRWTCDRPSYSWQNGLYVVIRCCYSNIWISKLKDGELNVPSTGKYDYSVTTDSEYVTITKLTYKVDPKLVDK